MNDPQYVCHLKSYGLRSLASEVGHMQWDFECGVVLLSIISWRLRAEMVVVLRGQFVYGASMSQCRYWVACG